MSLRAEELSGDFLFAQRCEPLYPGQSAQKNIRVAVGGGKKELYEYLEPYLLQLALTAVNMLDPFALVIGGELLEPYLDELNSRFVERLRDSSWQRAPVEFVTYSMRQCNCALGAALDVRDQIIDILARDEM